jgi:6-phosphogluconolactonase (cycloisomerase 2 family)
VPAFLVPAETSSCFDRPVHGRSKADFLQSAKLITEPNRTMDNQFPKFRLLMAASVLACCVSANAQQYLFTNDNIARGNSTTALSTNLYGAITVLETYPTGGNGSGEGSYYGSQPIVAAQTSDNSCLFVANNGSSTIAAFQINLLNGGLTAVSGSPFSDGESGDQSEGISLAQGKGELLFAGNSHFNSISVMKIAPDCSLTLANTVALSYSPVALKVTPNSGHLIASYLGPVDAFHITYSSSQITEQGPFEAQGATAGIDIDCNSEYVYFGDASANTQVEVFSLENGILSEVDDFTDTQGENSNTVLLSADQKKLYVTGNQSNQISVLSVNGSGSLSFAHIYDLKDPGSYALGLATDETGEQVFVSEVNKLESIGVFATKWKTLAELKNSPYSIINNDRAFASLVAVPSYSCPAKK